LSNSETAPSICRISFDVGVSSRNDCGAVGCDQLDAQDLQLGKADLLHH
jgi:hypothetical protein